MTTTQNQHQPDTNTRQRVSRIEVHPLNDTDDPIADNTLSQIKELDLAPDITNIKTARVYLIQSDFDQTTIEKIATELLTDPVNQRYRLGSTPRCENAQLIEVHYLPGVMDPVAQSTTDAITEMIGHKTLCRVRTGFRYDLFNTTPQQATEIANRLLANTVIQSISDLPEWPQQFVQTKPYDFKLTHVQIRDLDDDQLTKLSRAAHLFLSLNEMRTIRDHFRSIDREPTDVELETLAQTWSEHCVHKTFKSTINYSETSPKTTPATTSPSINDFKNCEGRLAE